MDQRTLREAFDACRPGSDDRSLPEVAEALQAAASSAETAACERRSLAWEGPLAAAMHDVELPAGLADRLLAGLTSAAWMEQAASAGPSADDAGEELTGPAPRPVRSDATRRRWLWGSLTAAACLAVAIGLRQWLGGEELNCDDVIARATQWYASASERTWRPMDSAPGEFPLPRAVLAAARGWQRVDRGVAYRLSSPRLGKAVVLVLDLVVAGLPKSPPREPQSTTGGQQVAAWQSAGRLYVIVVQSDGDPNRYRRLVDTSAPTLA